jgi:hypothetical protein
MADKYIYLNGGVLTELEATVSSAGAGNAGDIVALDGSGKLDITTMPSGVGADTISATAGEALSAGDLVYFNGSGNALKADANAVAKAAVGYVLASISNGASGTIYLSGTITGLTSLTPGAAYYLSTTPGGITTTAPTGTADIVQRVGYALSATSLTFDRGEPVVRA